MTSNGRPARFEAEGRGAQADWLTVEVIDDRARVIVGDRLSHTMGEGHQIALTQIQTVEFAKWLIEQLGVTV